MHNSTGVIPWAHSWKHCEDHLGSSLPWLPDRQPFSHSLPFSGERELTALRGRLFPLGG